MNQNFKGRFILAACISISLIACNGNEKKDEKAATTDSTKTENVEPVSNNADMDAVKVAPDLYKILKDTLGIRIVEVSYKPGDSSAMHWHPDYAIITTEGGTATFYGKDGSKMESEMKTGMTLVKAGEFHSVKNTGKAVLKVVLVEVNRTGPVTMPDAALDATKVAPNLYKMLNDSLGIRVLSINYKPGQSSAMHAHPDAVLYVFDSATSEFTGKDGKKTVMKLEKGMTAFIPADTHSVKNTGKTTVKAILVEVNRAMK